MYKYEALSYDDVLIEPGFSDIETRSSIDLSQDWFLGRPLEVPLISANMDYVTGYDMALAMHQNGGAGILNRFYPWDDQVKDSAALAWKAAPAFISVGTRDISDTLDKLEEVYPWVTGICIDIAHGHHKKVLELINEIRKVAGTWIIAGNVATYDGFMFLADAGANAIKVGIGPGSVCTTREVTGVGVPQLSAIFNCADAADAYSIKLIADGGIKNSGDIVKALVAGADAVMLGSLLAGADECPGESRTAPDNSVWRPFNGQSIYGTNGHKYTPEGIEGWVPSKGPVEGIIKGLVGGIRSGMSYVGANNLTELRTKARFIRVSPMSQIESGTRIAKTYL